MRGLAQHAEAATVMKGDGGVAAPSPVELPVGPQPVDAGDIEVANR